MESRRSHVKLMGRRWMAPAGGPSGTREVEWKPSGRRGRGAMGTWEGEGEPLGPRGPGARFGALICAAAMAAGVVASVVDPPRSRVPVRSAERIGTDARLDASLDRALEQACLDKDTELA